MIKIELEPLEHKDIITYLKYAQVQKETNKPTNNIYTKFDSTNYDINRIEQLIEVLETKESRMNIYKANAYVGYLTPREKQKIRYEKERKKKEMESLVEVL